MPAWPASKRIPNSESIECDRVWDRNRERLERDGATSDIRDHQTTQQTTSQNDNQRNGGKKKAKIEMRRKKGAP